MTPEALTAAQQLNFGHLLFACARLLDETAQAEVNRQAGRRVARPALMRVVPHLSEAGIRPTELARRLDVSKQAVSQVVAELREQGWVELRPDPSDGRASLVCLTDAGRGVFADGLAVLGFYEHALAVELSEAELLACRTTLAKVLRVLEGWQTSGAPARCQPRMSRSGAGPVV